MSAREQEARDWSVAHTVAAALQRHGVTEVFGQSIPSVLHLVGPEFGIRQIAYRSENAGGAMADAYARISNKVAVVTAQNGPAATLLVAPLAEALKASVPIVALVQDVARPTVDRNAFQELDHLALFQGCAKWVRRVERADRVEDYIDMAFTVAASGRAGPAVLLLPMDLLRERANPAAKRSSRLGRYPLDPGQPAEEPIREAAALLASAQRPLIVAGGGVHLSQATAALVALGEKLRAPVVTTNMGKGAIDERHELAAGVFGNCMGEGSLAKPLRRLASEADVVLLVGTRTNQNGTDGWTLFPRSAKFIHIDADSQEVGRNYESLRLVGDARLTLEALLRAGATPKVASERPAAGTVTKLIKEAKDQFRARLADTQPGARGAIRPEYLMQRLDAHLRDGDVVVGDASYASNWVATYLTARGNGSRILTPRGLAGLGWGVPMAMGAKLARPSARVVAVVGDGGFAHCWSELETMRREGIDVLTIVLHNRILGYQAHAENVQYGNHTSACALTDVDHAAIARACGCKGVRLEEPAEIGAALDTWFRDGGPTLLDVSIDPGAYPPLNMYEGKKPLEPTALHIIA